MLKPRLLLCLPFQSRAVRVDVWSEVWSFRSLNINAYDFLKAWLLLYFHLLPEIISQTCFFASPWRRKLLFGPTAQKDLLFAGLIVPCFPLGSSGCFFFSETMENGFKSHVSYFTLWQVMQAPPYKWWLLKVRGIGKWQIACAPCLSFFPLSFSLQES